ncbi:MAG: hypothetical protein ACM335_09665 [Deltaproteobacteria bacterium]
MDKKTTKEKKRVLEHVHQLLGYGWLLGDLGSWGCDRYCRVHVEQVGDRPESIEQVHGRVGFVARTSNPVLGLRHALGRVMEHGIQNGAYCFASRAVNYSVTSRVFG